ncbi:MAG TPA: aminotransferase class III-fold pyridoxal phosphate-dependent enzyme [Terrimicrobiaceae bacterium]
MSAQIGRDLEPRGFKASTLERLLREEKARFVARTPSSQHLLARARKSMPAGVPMAWMAGLYRHPPLFAVRGSGAYFEDADGNRYLDMNQADLAGSLGFAPRPIIEAVSRRAAEGSAFLLPIVASELLAERTGVPCWQYTGSASASNTETIRLARLATGRDQVLLFAGKYHGHIDEGLVSGAEGRLVPDGLGLPKRVTAAAQIVPFNDLAALETVLHAKEIACLLAEPMLTNCNLVFPDAGFWEAATQLVHDSGALLIIDEAHTHSFAFGGLTRKWRLRPDLLVLGKGLGSGIGFGAYGMTHELAELSTQYLEGAIAIPTGLAIGGTTYGNALALAAARAALEHCLTPAAYALVLAFGAAILISSMSVLTTIPSTSAPKSSTSDPSYASFGTDTAKSTRLRLTSQALRHAQCTRYAVGKMFRVALFQWLAVGLCGNLTAQPVDEHKPYGRVCIGVVTDEIEAPLQASSKPGPNTKIVVHAEASEHCQMLVFAFNGGDGKLAHDWLPQFVELPQWEEVLLPKAPISWKWSGSSEPFEFYVLFLHPNSEEAKDLNVLIAAMLNPMRDRGLLNLQAVKLYELTTRSISGATGVIDVAKIGRVEVAATYRGSTLPWRTYASGANFSEAKPALLIFRMGDLRSARSQSEASR